MEAIIFSDLHYQEHPEFPFQEVADNVLKQIEEYVIQNHIKNIFHLGDLFNSRMKMPVRLISPLSKFFQVLMNE
jgi:hypothetical protein